MSTLSCRYIKKMVGLTKCLVIIGLNYIIIMDLVTLSVGQKGTLSYIPALLIKQDWTTKTMQIIEDK